MPEVTPLPLGHVLEQHDFLRRLERIRGEASIMEEGIALFRDTQCDCYYTVCTDEENCRVIGSTYSGFVAQRLYEYVALLRTGIDI